MQPMTIRPPGHHDVPGHPGLKSTYGWWPGIPKEVVLRVSKTTLGAFGFCRHQYFLKNVIGVKEPKNDNMTRGTNVHDAVEDFYDAIDLSEAVQAREIGFDAVLQMFTDYIPDRSKEKEFRGEFTPSEPFTLGEQEHLRRYMEIEAARFMGCDPEDFLPVINEGGFDALIEIEVGDAKVPVHLTGIMDRVFRGPDGALHVHELKTGTWKDKKSKWESMREEMAYYVMLMHNAEGKEITHWGWDHTGGDFAFRTVEPVQMSSLLSMRKSLSDLVRAHMGYLGGVDGATFDTLGLGAESSICEPYCAVKGYCTKYGRPLMPYDLLSSDTKEEE